MKYVLQLLFALGAAAFAVGLVMRLLDTGKLLNASPAGWWRASIGLIAIGVLYALIQILGELRKR